MTLVCPGRDSSTSRLELHLHPGVRFDTGNPGVATGLDGDGNPLLMLFDGDIHVVVCMAHAGADAVAVAEAVAAAAARWRDLVVTVATLGRDAAVAWSMMRESA